MCTAVLKEVVRYYNNNHSTVYACAVDASKAFDRVRHDKLFNMLIQRKVSPLDLGIMLSQYHRQKLRTMWNGSYSSYFDVENGVKQGAIASPTLFCIYMDEL